MKREKNILIAILFLVIINSVVPIKKAYDIEEYIDICENFVIVTKISNSSGQWAITEKYRGGKIVWEGEEVVHLDGSLAIDFDNGIKLNGNKYLCKIEETGDIFNEATQEYMTSYHILEYYPLKPIQRDSILPSFFYNKNYFNFWDYFKI